MIEIKEIVIVGTGQAGFQAATSLREGGFEGRLVMIGDEPGLSYQRPPLSKAYLLEKTTEKGLLLRPEAFYASKRIEFIAGEKVETIDRGRQRVTCGSGLCVPYDHLILATGARNRRLGNIGDHGDSIFYLRDLMDARSIKRAMRDAKNVVVVGAGFIGLEFAAVANTQGINVTVLDMAPRPLSRAVTPKMSTFFAEQHREWGVDLRCATQNFGLQRSQSQALEIELPDGEQLHPDMILVGIGVIANEEIAAAAGIVTSNGIVVDEFLTTSDPNISAIGDCAAFPARYGSDRVRLESVQNAVDQARCLASTLIGNNKPFDSTPWFWSDQKDLKLQIVGLTAGADRAISVGNSNERSFSVFCFKGERLLGIETVNQITTHMAGRRVLQQNLPLTPDEVESPNFSLKEYAARAARTPSDLTALA